ncbi:uncharacterized protein LOC124916012 [Impatiens glandulifera]|uniref:uncharacterized protein LOC124916012 n=1 Tax=Impatiens glandulifera TaxID=253017 RepID=UPI001FB19826|nr:uncharacterized protein LOC124916012 [Impatiens glandulifera]
MTSSLHDCLSKCMLNQTYLTELVKSCILECVPPQPQSPQPQIQAPLVWIGLYVAGASLVCMLLMGADFINGLRTKKYWFPCKFFTLNAAISAVLAISLKMPVDLTTLMPSGRDQLMKLCGTTLMSVSMANFMPSLADMSVAELFANLISLAVFIVPLVSNICIQIGTGVISKTIVVEHVIIIVCIILQFAFLIFTALVSTTVKKCFKSNYKGVFDHFQGERTIKIQYIRSLWITSNTQFVIARYVTSIASGAICLVSVVVLAEVALQLYVPLSKKHAFFHPNSDYEWSSKFIVVAQLAAILDWNSRASKICQLYKSIGQRD